MSLFCLLATNWAPAGSSWTRNCPADQCGRAICGAAPFWQRKPLGAACHYVHGGGNVVLFGSLAMVVESVLFSMIGWDQGLYGIYIGAVHEVAHGCAGNAIGPEALANAVVVKLVRVMLLVPFLLLVGRWWLNRHATRQDGTQSVGKLTVPWFAFGFVAVALFNSVVTLPEALHESLTLTGQIALTMAMAALGYETRMSKLRALGIKPFALALMLFAADRWRLR